MEGSEPQHVIALDTETTGLNPNRDEVLSLSIIDRDGQIILDERFGPLRCHCWDAAQAVHGITPNDVKGLAPLSAHRSHIAAILGSADLLIGYNLPFDLAFMAAAGIAVPPDALQFDVMREFARIHGLRSGRHPHGCWASLENCARYYGLAFSGHSSLADAQATLFCFERICEETGRHF